LMFMGPMDGSPDFRDDGIGGMGRFVNRLWRAFNQYVADERTSDVLITKLHQTIKKVTEDIEGFDYNTAIASMMEFLNLWEDEKNLNAQDAKLFVKILAPFAPHLAEEVYQRLKVNSQRLKVKLDSVHTQSWPKYDPKLVVEESVTVVVQVNGKLRGQLEVKRQISNVKSQIEKLARQEQKVSQYLKGQQVKKVIFVPGKLVNFVTV